jgi:hypothetical protein
MKQPVFLWRRFPLSKLDPLPENDILEATMRGRSTQIKMLRRCLEAEGYAVSDTG